MCFSKKVIGALKYCITFYRVTHPVIITLQKTPTFRTLTSLSVTKLNQSINQSIIWSIKASVSWNQENTQKYICIIEISAVSYSIFIADHHFSFLLTVTFPPEENWSNFPFLVPSNMKFLMILVSSHTFSISKPAFPTFNNMPTFIILKVVTICLVPTYHNLTSLIVQLCAGCLFIIPDWWGFCILAFFLLCAPLYCVLSVDISGGLSSKRVPSKRILCLHLSCAWKHQHPGNSSSNHTQLLAWRWVGVVKYFTLIPPFSLR